jgi:LysM repeat protein
MDPRKAYRYGFLFDLDPLDYKSWAWGLKQAGYATNPRYALLLISIIENNELYVLDYYEPQSLLASASEAPIPPPKPTYQHSVLQKRQLQTPLWKQKPEQAPNKIEGIVTNNGLKMVYAHIGDTPASIAKAYNQSVREIITYNEKIEHKEQVLEYTERVYFQKKKRSYKGSIKFHRVEAGETMYDIAQTYGILLEKLYIRNRMFPGTEPAEGEKIRLRGMIKSKDRPKLRYVASKDLAKEEVPAITRHDQQSRKKHVVSVGDTLYGIALEYKLSVDVLKRINKLDSNLIKPGQILFID